MLSHSCDRFYVVTKFELPKVEDLRLITVLFHSKCSYLITRNHTQSSYFPKLLVYCQEIVPYVEFYKKQIIYYKCTTYKILKHEIDLILSTYAKDWTHKRGIIASVLGSIVQVLLVWHMKASLTYCIIKDTKPYTKPSNLWKEKLIYSTIKFIIWKIL